MITHVVVLTSLNRRLAPDASWLAESYTKSPAGHGDGGFVSLAQVVVLLALIFDASNVPVSDFPLLVRHESGPEDAFVVDLALADAVPRSESPGGAKVITCPPAALVPVHVVVPAAMAVPVVAICATPNERTGTEHKMAPAMSLRNTYFPP